MGEVVEQADTHGAAADDHDARRILTMIPRFDGAHAVDLVNAVRTLADRSGYARSGRGTALRSASGVPGGCVGCAGLL